jgi:hypothetical protein
VKHSSTDTIPLSTALYFSAYIDGTYKGRNVLGTCVVESKFNMALNLLTVKGLASNVQQVKT